MTETTIDTSTLAHRSTAHLMRDTEGSTRGPTGGQVFNSFAKPAAVVGIGAVGVAAYLTRGRGSAAAEGAEAAVRPAGRVSGGVRAAIFGVLAIALVGTAVWAGGQRGGEYTVPLASEPDLSPAQALPPRSDERRQMVADLIAEHFAASQAEVEPVLDELKDDGIISSWTAFPAANSYLADVNFGKADEFERAMAGLRTVGLPRREEL